MKPIETVYKGYRFRSRLEARWAVFLSHAGYEFQYEPEGYQLSQGWYLPDFFIPEINAFFEIKPLHLFSEDPVFIYKTREYKICWDLQKITGKVVALVFGDPMDCRFLHTCESVDNAEEEPSEFDKFLCLFQTCFWIDEKKRARQARFEHGEAPA